VNAAPVSAKQLLAKAREAADRAYAPYSNFSVGAAVLTAKGTVFIAGMVAASADDRTVRRVAVFSPNAAPCLPCGACRQVLREFGCQEVIVEEEGSVRIYRFGELLPHSFGPEALDR
jgi:cytidine deaminase